MSYPTGMGASTGNHYNRVAAQMQAYLNNPPQQQYAPMRSAQPLIPQMASQAIQFGASQFGFNPVIANDVSGFARSFVRNLFS